jgi:hypothetical protein
MGNFSSSGIYCEKRFPSAYGCFFESGLTFGCICLWDGKRILINALLSGFAVTAHVNAQPLNRGSPQRVVSDLGDYL